MTNRPIQPWETGEPERLLETRVFDVYRREARSRQDPTLCGEFVYLDVPDWVNVVAVTASDELVLIEQYRHGLDEVVLEIPGGIIDPGEDPIAAGRRELVEETGFRAGEGELIGCTTPNPAVQNNRLWTVLFERVDARVAAEPDEHEEIGVRMVPLERLRDLIQEGAIHHSLVVAGLCHYLLRRATR